jgi:methanogenic corrinoid protein MtbC1
MLNWCSYCQQFIGEKPPYEDLLISHGMCSQCESWADDPPISKIAHARTLRDIQIRLSDAGRSGDLRAAEQLIDESGKTNIRGVDLLLGIVAPMLYQIGDDWKQAIVSVAEEHRFTRFCEDVFDMVTARVRDSSPSNARDGEVLLMNAPGNRHTLATRILTLRLMSAGVRTQIVDMPSDHDALTTLIENTSKCRLILISMALAEQYVDISAFAERVATLPDTIRPKVIVGGYAVKAGLISAIPGAELMADISSLADIF